ncbi:transcriptional regulator [Weizmannia acidilactici]|uniref:Transcriptional regulator n=1 Tax=Weizmannia acidilactici TaxID=2607726 RepID=A0A5J4J502_9BACI|nr:two-component system activity regulator YycH [Weizmannia acidilactici]GER70046.1 transcriptional regulator [Weizmannia acidilactici]
MNLEKAKTFILTLLVLFSVFLTWMIWNNQPNYDWLNLKDLDNIAIAKEKKVSDVVLPVKILYHENSLTTGTVHDGEISRVMNLLKTWTFDMSSSRLLPKKDLYGLMSGKNRIELDFPNPVPFSVYQNVLNFANKKIPNGNFDHIVVELNKGTKNLNHVYFISLVSNKVYEASTDQKAIQVFIAKLNENHDLYKPYEEFSLSGSRKVYLPAGNPVMNQYKYATTEIDIDKFKKALFVDPNFVKRVAGEYTNGISLLRTDESNKVLTYVNPGENIGYSMDPNHLLTRAIDFINQHSGWMDQYQYFEMNEKENKVVFRLFKDGYPVFNNDGMAEIQEYQGKNEIYKYVRPYYALSLNLPIKSAAVQLASARNVIAQLQKDPSIQMDKVTDIAAGYRLIKEEGNEGIVSLKPAWYYCYNGTWRMVGGDEDGLE